MGRVLTALLTLVVLFASLAQAFDLHDESGCADASNPTLSDSNAPARGDAPDLHAAGCCFGSIVLTMPQTYSNLMVTTVKLVNGVDTTQPPTWHSDSPERPPRS